jgi:glycerol-3-phosphate O-acyltransferase
MATRVLDGKDIARDVSYRVIARSLSRIGGQRQARIEELANETVYAEQARLAHAEEDPRTAEDRQFVGWLRRELAHASDDRRRELVAIVVERYVTEISGHFDRRVYGLATRVVPPALSALLRGFGHGRWLGSPQLFDVDDRVVVDGHASLLRSLARIGTIVLAPTHVSNLDSVVLGAAIYRLGLPPFAYGAGLNLFSSRTIGFFMRNLGAYTVDRKKTDPLYRETLKEYVTTLLERGQHNLFFPGGTRSRSGAIERHLKLGLLGTAPIAYFRSLVSGAPQRRIFVVPCTITYPLVLEADTLIHDFLREEGRAHYVDVRDEFERPERWVSFIGSLMKLDHRVYVTVGRPLDVLGNDVDEAGISRDPRGRALDTRRYFLVDGKPEADEARDSAYARLLASRLRRTYLRDNRVLPTSLTAFVVLALLRRERREPDPFRFLRGVAPDASVDVAVLRAELARAMTDVGKLADASRLRVPAEVRVASADHLMNHALSTFATYHSTPVLERRGSRVYVNDVDLLYYYGNRLSGYDLLGEPELIAKRERTPE